jgi:hypothetical protein
MIWSKYISCLFLAVCGFCIVFILVTGIDYPHVIVVMLGSGLLGLLIAAFTPPIDRRGKGSSKKGISQDG